MLMFSLGINFHAGVDFTELPAAVPEVGSSYCVAGIDENRIFITALGYERTYMYDKRTEEWESLPEMPVRRSQMGCGVARNDAGNAHVVVVGGYSQDVGYVQAVDIYSVEDQRWTRGN